MALHLVVFAAALVAVASHGDHHGFRCGVDDPAFDSYVNAGAVRMPVGYESEASRSLARKLAVQAAAANGRELAAQDYGSGAFVPLSQLNAAGQAGYIRIGLVWDPVDHGDYSPGSGGGGSVPRQCSFVGQSIYVQNSNGVEVNAPNVCETVHLVTGVAGAARGQAMRERTLEAQEFWQAALKIRPVQDAQITIDSSVVNDFNLTTTNVANVDLIIIMTARPSPNRPVAGYASCRQRDQYNRCTVGTFNWVPELLDVEKKTNPDVVSSEMHTALHEMMHVLGGMNPGSSAANTPFIDDNGHFVEPRGNVFIEEMDSAYNKMVSKIITPKVLNVSRTYFGCPTMNGFPLEDVPLGKGSHWEARLAGPELMSYGSGSGQVFIGDLTFAYLEDTNQYIANYSMGGKLTPDNVDDFALTALSFTQVDDSSTTYTPPAPPSPGAMLWGMGQGCAFVNGHARSWPASYTCTTNQEYGCTADNRMSAVCIVKGDYTQEPSCPSYYINQATGTVECGLSNNACSGGNCGIPTSMQFFSSNAAAAAASAVTTATTASTGGFSSSMDYVPVQVGYWSCNTQAPAGNVSAGSEGSQVGFNNFASLFGSATDMEKFGGQARCPNCRCFKSSLLELTRSITPTFKVYGLCYRMNCYREDYLQIAIKGQLGSKTVFWYKCPTEGGKLYITGFTGAFHCPPAVSFCARETITGSKYPEQSFVFEVVFWGALSGLVLIFALACICPCLRDRMVLFFKRLCGAMQFPTEYEEVVSADKKTRTLKVIPSKYNLKQEQERMQNRSSRRIKKLVGAKDGAPEPSTRLPGSCASWTLFIVNMLTFAVGLAMVGLVSYSIYAARLLSVAIPMLGVSVLVCIVGFVGILASRKRAEHGPSCWLLTYFYFNVVLSLLLLWTIAYNLSYTNWDTYVSKNWDVITDVLPDKYRTGATRAEQIASAVKAIQDNMVVIAALAISVLVVYLSALMAAARLLHINTLASMTLSIANNLFVVLGVILTVVGVYLVTASGRAGGVVTVIAVVLALGIITLILGVLGSIAVFRKNAPALVLYLAFVVALVGFFGYALWLFISQSAKIAGYVDGLDDEAIAKVATDVGLSMSKAEVQAKLQDSLHQLALAIAVGIGIAILLFVAGVIYFRAVRAERANKELDTVPNIDDVDKIADPATTRMKAQTAAAAATAGGGVTISVARAPPTGPSPTPVAAYMPAPSPAPAPAPAPVVSHNYTASPPQGGGYAMVSPDNSHFAGVNPGLQPVSPHGARMSLQPRPMVPYYPAYGNPHGGVPPYAMGGPQYGMPGGGGMYPQQQQGMMPGMAPRPMMPGAYRQSYGFPPGGQGAPAPGEPQAAPKGGAVLL